MRSMLLVVVLVGLCISVAMAADQATTKEQPSQAKQEMPPMGPPPEMKQIAYLVGTWDYVMKMKMDMSSDKMEETKGVSKAELILDGAALAITTESEFNGMKFKGFSVQTYDRESRKWQISWTDNMGARTSLYTGEHTSEGTVFMGEEQMGGMKMLSRITSYNEKPTSYDWKMESSMDGGKTWMLTGTATYTKRP